MFKFKYLVLFVPFLMFGCNGDNDTKSTKNNDDVKTCKIYLQDSYIIGNEPLVIEKGAECNLMAQVEIKNISGNAKLFNIEPMNRNLNLPNGISGGTVNYTFSLDTNNKEAGNAIYSIEIYTFNVFDKVVHDQKNFTLIKK